MKKFFQEFKTFAMKGNVVDMAVGIIIGAAFGKIVTSFVNDIIMPPIGLLVGGVNFTDLQIVLKEATIVDGAEVAAVTLNYGNFIQVIFDFLIVAFAVYIVIRMINKLSDLKKKEEAPKPEEVPAVPEPTKEEMLLTEIRDLLKSKS